MTRIAWTKFSKPVLDMAESNDTLAFKAISYFSCFCNVFSIFELSLYYKSNMYFQFLHFKGMGS